MATFAAKLRSIKDLHDACCRDHADGKDHTERLNRLERKRAALLGEIADDLGISVWDLRALIAY